MLFENYAHYWEAKCSIYGRTAMASKPSSSDVYAPNFLPEPTPDEALTTSFILSLGAAGRKERRIYIYE